MVKTAERFGTPEKNFDKYIKNYPQKPDGNFVRNVRWACIDDRPTLSGRLHRQTASGALGVGEDLGAAMLMHPDNSEAFKRRIPAAHKLGAMAAQILSPHGIKLYTHVGCAAEGSARPIKDAIVEDSELVFNHIQKATPQGMSETRFEQIANAFGRLKLIDEGTAAKKLDEGTSTPQLFEPSEPEQLLHPVDRLHLVDRPHVAKDVLFNYQQGKAFRTEDAFYEQSPAYHASIGDMGELAQPLQEAGFVFDERDFFDVSIVRNATTTLFLPGQEERPHNLHVIQ